LPINIHFGFDSLFGFLLTLTRVGSALVIFPIPGFRDTPQIARIALIVTTTMCLFPVWPSVHLQALSGGQFFLTILGETAAGMALGLAMSLLSETFQIAAQTIAMQTGFGFASTIDPNSQADSTVFQVMTQLTTGLLFFTLGIHYHLLRFFGASFSIFGSGPADLRAITAKAILSMGSTMLVNGLRMGLPVVTLLLLIDLALAVLGRLNAQMQLLSLAFPAKIVLSYLFLAALIVRWPGLNERAALQIFESIARIFTPTLSGAP
jgi:flagellar biosynthetic protein FliR